MIEQLSLDNINAHSPYFVELDNATGLYKFVSDYGVSLSEYAKESIRFFFILLKIIGILQYEQYISLPHIHQRFPKNPFLTRIHRIFLQEWIPIFIYAYLLAVCHR